MRKIIAAGALVVLAGCGAPPDEPVEAVVEGGGILDEPRREIGMQTIVAIAADPDWGRIEAEARALCEGKTHCGVLGWTDPAQMASAMPMLDREAEALAFSYSLNRTTSFERFMVDCTRWPQGDDATCLATLVPDAVE